MKAAHKRAIQLLGGAVAIVGLLVASEAGAVCNLQRLQELDALSDLVEITGVHPQTVIPGGEVVVTGNGFGLVPASELYVSFQSRTPSIHPQTHCPSTSGFRYRSDRASNLRVISDGEMRVTAPPGVRDHGLGPGEVRLIAIAGPCAASTPSTGPYPFEETRVLAQHPFASAAQPGPASPAIRGFAIYLDFDGHTAWRYARGGDDGLTQTIGIAPFVRDSVIREEIRKRVAEDYAPFDAEVVPSEPAGLEDGPGVGIRVAIGGTTADLAAPGGSPVAGLSVDPGRDNTVLVAEFFSDGTPRLGRDIAKTVSHEVAHALGFAIRHPLAHYGLEHTDPTNWRARILQQGEVSARTTWWADFDVDLGFDLCAGTPLRDPQEDIATLLSALGARPDDHGDEPEDATPLLPDGQADGDPRVAGEGVIGMNAASWPQCAPDPCPGGQAPAVEDRDFFVFASGPERFRVRVDTWDELTGLAGAANLDAELELWHLASGSWQPVTSVARQHTASDLWAEIAHDGQGGTYAVAVVSHGDYGDLGRYRVRAWGGSVSAVSAAFGWGAPDELPTPGFSLLGSSLHVDALLAKPSGAQPAPIVSMQPKPVPSTREPQPSSKLTLTIETK
jgi:hypothetical protein